MKLLVQSVALALSTLILAADPASAALYFNDFETNTVDWTGATRVASGTGGIPSADSSSFHALAAPGAFTRFGGYNYGAGPVPTAFQEYTTSLDIFLNVGGGFANDTRFDFTSAISNSAGNHLRDFAFNVGFYNNGDITGPGSGTDRFVVSAGTTTGRANSFPKNTGSIAISTTGWYTFQNHFYDNGGVLNVDMSIFDSSNALVSTWTLGSDAIGGVGGSRYGWFPSMEVSSLAIDNAQLSLAVAAVPEPASLIVWSLLGLTVGGATWWRRRMVAA